MIVPNEELSCHVRTTTLHVGVSYRGSTAGKAASPEKTEVGAAILLMKPVLEKVGVRLKSVVDDFGDEKYQVVINGMSHLIHEGGGGKIVGPWRRSGCWRS